jgi:DNA-binding CsgD family transcriptional regulator
LPKHPTHAQTLVLALLAKGASYSRVCAILGIARSTAMNQASQGCKRLGITVRGQRRALEIRKALAMLHAAPDPMNDPMF